MEASSVEFGVMMRPVVVSAAAAAAVLVAALAAANGMVPNGRAGGEEIVGKTTLAIL